MGLVLWIDKNTFATSILEKVFKGKNLPFYTLSDVADFTYLVNDLKPVLIVLDSSTVLSSLDAFKTQYDSIKSLPVVIIDGENELDFIRNVVGRIQRPFDPFEIPEILKKYLKLS